MEQFASPRKKLRSPVIEGEINTKTSITCTNVPEGLFDPDAAKKHFLKFGKIQKIRLFPKRQMCIIEYEHPMSVEGAVLNAGAYDGFMFDVTRSKARVRKLSKKSDTAAWGQSSEVEEELSAMSGAPSVGLARMKSTAAAAAAGRISSSPRIGKLNSPLRKKVPIRPKQQVVKRRSKVEDDPEWLPNSEEEDELLSMDDSSTNRIPRQKPMDGVEMEAPAVSSALKIPKVKYPPAKSNLQVQEQQLDLLPSVSGTESPVPVATLQTSLTTSEAASELNQLRYKVSLTPDEQWRTLDARDRILRAWGGAGSRVKVGGATIGTCPDMCPEKERLHRQAEHQVMTLETIQDSDGELELWRAVKQYSRSSADQEIPMCYELRPAPVLMRTCAYLLNEIADAERQVSLADWFHFMWDRFRGVRKDITQQALCCPDSIRLVEMCARFHAHCAARLADLEHTQFDQKLNTDNLTKCLQTLKHMYADVKSEHKPMEAEFRGYVALLNMGDANFWWEIKQLPKDIQKSEPILFAIETFNALDNNNYVKFFRLVKYKATYLQACILLRYFNDVRARALARIVKAFAPRGSSRYPAYELLDSLAFESLESLKSFITHYGLRFAKTDDAELTVILDRNKFIEDTDPYPLSRAINLIESKRQGTVGEAIMAGPLPKYEFSHQNPYSSFTREGKLKESALIAEDQNYNTINDSNKDIQGLKSEIERLAKSGKSSYIPEKTEVRSNNFTKPEPKPVNLGTPYIFTPTHKSPESKLFSFKPAIPVAPTEIIKNSPEKIFDSNAKNIFSFSKPQESLASDVFKVPGKSIFSTSTQINKSNVFTKKYNENKETFPSSQNVFKTPTPIDSNPFTKQEGQTVFGQIGNSKNIFNISNERTKIFGANSTTNVESTKDTKDTNVFGNNNIFSNVKSNSVFVKSDRNVLPERNNSIFLNPTQGVNTAPPSVFGAFSKPKSIDPNLKSMFVQNGEATSIKSSPGSLFKSAINADSKEYSIFQSKSKDSVAKNIFNSVNETNKTVYDFDPNEDETSNQAELSSLSEQRQKQEEDRIRQEEEQKLRKEEERKQELSRQEEVRRKELEQRKQEELKLLEEKRKKEEEERKREELKKRMEDEHKAEMKRKAEEEIKFKEKVDKETSELIEELTKEVNDETIANIMCEEMEKIKDLMAYAGSVSEEILTELCNEICYSEMRAEKYWTEKLLRKWFYTWRKQLKRNLKRRSLLEDTPVWLPDNTPVEEACHLRRLVENAALKNMNAIHRGYRFFGEPKQLPCPEPYNLMYIIKSCLLKRMKQIKYPYGKCFFWKVSLICPGNTQWLCRKIDIKKWILDVFSDGKKHASNSLIHVDKQSWNNLLDFAISVGFKNYQEQYSCNEAIDGANGLLFYINERDARITDKIGETLRLKYPYQVIPLTVIMPKWDEIYNALEIYLNKLVENNTISEYKIYFLDEGNVFNSLNSCTKSALKWMAKKYPQIPPLEIDYLKSICQRYLGNEIWCRLRSERNGRLDMILKDLRKLIKCYNVAVDKLTDVITNEDLFNYPSFPLEFKVYLDELSPYPNPYEYIPSSVKNAENISEIKDLMKQLKLPDPRLDFQPLSVLNMQHQIRNYCNQIGCFEDPEEVVCKVVAVLPDELLDLDMPCEQFTQYYEHYDLIDLLNVIIYEKINRLNKFNNRYAIYEKKTLEDYRNLHWLHDVNVLSTIKHKAIDYEDELDVFIKAKRRKIELDSMEYLMLEDKDCTLVEENIKATDASISKYNNCNDAVKQLEEKIEEEKMKSIELENLLRTALSEL